MLRLCIEFGGKCLVVVFVKRLFFDDDADARKRRKGTINLPEKRALDEAGSCVMWRDVNTNKSHWETQRQGGGGQRHQNPPNRSLYGCEIQRENITTKCLVASNDNILSASQLLPRSSLPNSNIMVHAFPRGALPRTLYAQHAALQPPLSNRTPPAWRSKLFTDKSRNIRRLLGKARKKM